MSGAMHTYAMSSMLEGLVERTGDMISQIASLVISMFRPCVMNASSLKSGILAEKNSSLSKNALQGHM